MYYGYEFGNVYGFEERADRTEWIHNNLNERYSLSYEVARKMATEKQNGAVYDYYDGSIVKEF